MSNPLESGNPSGFRPQRQGQVDSPMTENTDDHDQSASTPAFTRQTQKQTDQRSVFPEWDLLPPKSIIRRKGSS